MLRLRMLPVSGPPPARVRVLAHKRVASGTRVAWSASKVITGPAMLGVRGAIPRGRVAVTINVGDGPYLHGHTLVGER